MTRLVGSGLILIALAIPSLVSAQATRKRQPPGKKPPVTQPVAPGPSAFDNLDQAEIPPKVLEVLPPETVAVVSGSIGPVYRCALSVDGKLAFAGEDGAIEVWDLSGSSPRKRMALSLGPERDPKKSGWVSEIAFSPDGRLLAAGRWARAEVWDVSQGQARSVRHWDLERLNVLAFHPSGRWLAVGHLDDAFEVSADLFESSPEGIAPTGSKLWQAIRCLRFSSDGSWVAAGRFVRERNGDLYASEVKFWKLQGTQVTEGGLIRENLTIRTERGRFNSGI